MTHTNRILRSTNNQSGDRCVDIFVRPDGSVGFEEYRRDVEDPRGWFAIGHHSGRTFQDEASAWEAARTAIRWLA